MELTKENMPETMYRASRFCRVLGNPTAYLILRCLDENRLSVKELASRLHINVYTASSTLRDLRNIDAVRYIAVGSKKLYWLKDKELLAILVSLEVRVDAMREKQA